MNFSCLFFFSFLFCNFNWTKKKNQTPFYNWDNYFAFDAAMIFLIEFRALDATKIGDSTACFFSLMVFSSDFSRSICVLLSVRLPRFIDVFAAATAAAAALKLLSLLHGDSDCVHFVDARARFRQMIRGVIVVGVVAVADGAAVAVVIVLLVHTVCSTTLPFRASISVNAWFRCGFARSATLQRIWLVFRSLLFRSEIAFRSHFVGLIPPPPPPPMAPSHRPAVTVFERLRWHRGFFTIDWSSKHACVRDNIEMPADAAGVDACKWWLRCIDIERDRFMSSLLHFDVPQPMQCDISADGYVLSLLLLLLLMVLFVLLFCVLEPGGFRILVYAWSQSDEFDVVCGADDVDDGICCCSLIK